MPRVTRTSPPDARARAVFRRLRAEYPDARCSLTFSSPWELLVATILSAQCTDDRVNMVTPGLFRRFPTPEALAGAEQRDVEEAIRSTGFFRNKARSLVGAARAILHDHEVVVPYRGMTIEEGDRLLVVGQQGTLKEIEPSFAGGN